ncbi:MAG: ribonuclease P protein component [Clostridiales bacterium]|nr:ribonuclease P protein component [Clostridiales bacterium]
MKHTQSLKKNSDFRTIYRTGKSYANKYLVMYIKNNNLNENRLGISVSKKVGNSVIRHRITRLIRESYRLSEDKIKSGYDIIIVSRVGAKGKSYSEIESALMHLIRLHKIEKNIEVFDQIESDMVEV